MMLDAAMHTCSKLYGDTYYQEQHTSHMYMLVFVASETTHKGRVFDIATLD